VGVGLGGGGGGGGLFVLWVMWRVDVGWDYTCFSFHDAGRSQEIAGDSQLRARHRGGGGGREEGDFAVLKINSQGDEKEGNQQ